MGGGGGYLREKGVRCIMGAWSIAPSSFLIF